MSERDDEAEVITIFLQRRGDGGLRVWSDDVRGILLSHSDPAKVMADILPVIDTLKAWRALPPESQP